MSEPLLENPRALSEKIAGALGGRPVEHEGLSGFLNSEFDRFLNQLFASEKVAPQHAVAALGGRPGFVWLGERPNSEDLGRLRLLEMYGMAATTAVRPERRLPSQGPPSLLAERLDYDFRAAALPPLRPAAFF